MRLPRRLTPHTATVEEKIGTNSAGDVYGPPRVIEHCQASEGVRVVRGPNGAELTVSGRLIEQESTAPIPPGSRVTMPSGRVLTVVQVNTLYHPPVETFYDADLG